MAQAHSITAAAMTALRVYSEAPASQRRPLLSEDPRPSVHLERSLGAGDGGATRSV